MADLQAGTAAEFVRALRAGLGLTQRELASRAAVERSVIVRIEAGGETEVPTLRRLIASFGGRLELAARFERPLEALADELRHERDAIRLERFWERRRAQASR